MMRSLTVMVVAMVGLFQCGSAVFADSLTGLRVEHPRLIFTREDWTAFANRVECRASDPQFDVFLSTIEADAQALLAAPPLVHRKVGYRLLDVSREALRRVLTLTVAYRATGDGRFLRCAEENMCTAAAFPDWNPSHFLDVAEMTTALALGYDWLYDELSADARAEIRQSIIEKGIREGVDPQLPRNRWHRIVNNWNQVCLGGLVLGALAVAEDAPELSCAMLDATRAGISNGLKPYASDGIYPEGPGYWSYGTTYQVLLIAALESALGSDWGLRHSPGFMESANAQLFLTGPTGGQYNFSDCREMRLFDPALYWFAKKLNNPVLASVPESKKEGRFVPLAALWWPEGGVSRFGSHAPDLPLVWMGEGQTPVAVFRSSWTDPNALYLACKGGSADISHGHMDAGSFILESDGVRWAVDLGMQEYESLESKGLHIFGRAQDAPRWSVFRMNNFSHNTLTIDGQLHRVDGRAEFIEFDQKSMALIELAPVFSGQALSVRRRFDFSGEYRHVRITDTLAGVPAGQEIRWAMFTRAEIEIDASGARAVLSQNGKTMVARLIAPIGDAQTLHFEKARADPPVKDYDEPNPNTRILIVRAKAPVRGSVCIAVEFSAP